MLPIRIKSKRKMSVQFVSKLDIFQVDSVFIQRQRKKTKNVLGGIFTILVPVLCSIAFALLFVNNQEKPDIVTNELISTATLDSSYQARIEWNSEFVDVSTVYPFEMVTASGKSSMCYQNRGPFSSTEFPVCNYGTDLIGEQNGVGYVFKLKIPTVNKYILPIQPSDFILYHEKNLVAYVVSSQKNQFCVYYISQFQSKCYPFKFILITYSVIIKTNNFKIGDDVYVSINDNMNTTYLFKNHRLLSKDSTGYKYYVNPYTLFTSNVTAKEEIVSLKTIPSGNITNITIMDGSKYYEYLMTDVFNYYSVTPKKNSIEFILDIYSYEQGMCMNTSVFTISNSSVYIDNNMIPIYSLDCTNSSSLVTDNTEIKTKLRTNYLFTVITNTYSSANRTEYQSCIIVFDFKTHTFKGKTLSSVYNMPKQDIYRAITSGNGYISNVLTIIDAIDANDETLQIAIIDTELTITYIDDFTNKNTLYVTNYWSSYKTSENTIISTFLEMYIPTVKNNWKNVDNMGGIVECVNKICSPLYVNSFNVNGIQSATDLSIVVATATLNGKSILIRLKDVLPSTTPKNEYRVNVYDVYTKNGEYTIDNVNYKRLYSINVKNEPLLNSSSTNFTDYYVYDNNQLGHDKKFSCIPNPTTRKIDFDGWTIPSNKINCPVYNYINIPFIFDNGYQMAQDDSSIKKVSSTNLTGVFLVNLNPFISKTTITSTKAPFFSIVANTFSVYSVLLTLFMFIKNRLYIYANKDELDRRDTIQVEDSTGPNLECIVVVDTDKISNDQKNIELTQIRGSQL